jgi:hypothetical protein
MSEPSENEAISAALTNGNNEALDNLFAGVVLGAASIGVVLTKEDIRAAFDEAMAKVLLAGEPHTDWIGDLVTRKAIEQGVAPPPPKDPCHRCGRPAASPVGTIFVRREVDGRLRNVPMCEICWLVENPGREPVRVRP